MQNKKKMITHVVDYIWMCFMRKYNLNIVSVAL